MMHNQTFRGLMHFRRLEAIRRFKAKQAQGATNNVLSADDVQKTATCDQSKTGLEKNEK